MSNVKGKKLIFRAWIMKDGVKIYAKQFGIKAFPIWVDAEQ